MKNYCLVNEQNNICENVVVWDGDPNTWTPPADCLTLEQDTTPAKVWCIGPDKTTFVLVEIVGAGSVGFVWDGTYLVTNEPQPAPVSLPSDMTQPLVVGAQNL